MHQPGCQSIDKISPANDSSESPGNPNVAPSASTPTGGRAPIVQSGRRQHTGAHRPRSQPHHGRITPGRQHATEACMSQSGNRNNYIFRLARGLTEESTRGENGSLAEDGLEREAFGMPVQAVSPGGAARQHDFPAAHWICSPFPPVSSLSPRQYRYCGIWSALRTRLHRPSVCR